MKIEFDPAKSRANEIKHGISLSMARDLDLAGAIIREDRRFAYLETRFSALPMLGDRLHVVIFTLRDDTVRVISLRKANSRERRRNEEA